MWAVTNRVYREAPFQWEQTAWNELLPTFLWGQGDELPIRYRLLPVDQFSNIGQPSTCLCSPCHSISAALC